MNKKVEKTALLIFLLSFGIWAKILDTLNIEGLIVQKQEYIQNMLPLRSGQEFTSVQIQRAIKKLYSLGLFKDIQFFVEEETDTSASLRLKVVENPLCESIEYSGLKKVKQKDLEGKITLRKNDMVSDAMIHENITIIKNAYAEEGFLLVELECQLIESKVPGNVIVKFDIHEGKKVRIKKITLHGINAFSEKKIKRKLKTKEKRWFNTGEFLKDEYRTHLDTLIFFYQDKGFLDAKIVRDSIWYAENQKDIYLDLIIDEGKKYYAGDFYFTGNKILPKETLLACIAMKKGKPFNYTNFKKTQLFISNAYREEGYLWVQLKEQNHYRGDTIDITFDIVEGRAAIVRKIDITGNSKTREKVIRRELSIYPGQKYKQSRMGRSVRDVMMLNYFDNVAPDLRPNNDGTIDLVYTVEEKETVGQFSAGVMYSQVDKLGGNFNISMANFRGAGQKVSATVEFSKNRQNYSLGFTEPWIFDTPTLFSIRAFYEKHKARDYDYYSTGVEFGGGRRLKWPDDFFRINVGYRISYEKDNRYWDEKLPDFTILQDGLLSKLSVTFTRNDTKIPEFPVQGSIFSLNTQFGGLGGDYSFIKSLLNYEWYFPLFWKFVFGVKSEFGIVDGIMKEKKVSRTDLFRAGGVYYDGQIRGYDEGLFGQDATQGLTMLVLSSEMRFPIIEQQLYLGIFADAGNTWSSLRDVDVMDLYPGIGFGLRLNLPMVGLLGFDLAWALKDPNNPHFDKNLSKAPKPHFLMQQGF